MAGTSSEMERHAEEPTTRLVMKNQERQMVLVDQVTGVRLTISEFRQLELDKHREEKERMRNSQNPSGIYQIGGGRYSGITPESTRDLLRLENDGKMHRNRKIKKMSAEASVAEAGGHEESLKEAGKPGEAEGKQRDLIDSQEKLAKKKAKDEEAGEASVREAGKAEAYVIEAGKAAEAVANMNLAGGDSVISEEAKNELRKMAGLTSEMQQDAEEPLQMEAKAKKPKAKKKKTRKRMEHVAIGSYRLGEMIYEGVTHQEATELYKEHMLREDKLVRKEDRVCQYMLAGGRSLPESQEQLGEMSYEGVTMLAGGRSLPEIQEQLGEMSYEGVTMLAGGRSLPDSQEQLANKNEKKNGKKNRKNRKNEAKAEANLKEEEAVKAEASVTEAEKPEESVTQSGKAEASATEARKTEESVSQAGKPEEWVTQSGKAEAHVTDEETDDETTTVFEDAEYFGARFQSFWDKCWGHRCAYHETTTIPAMRYTHENDDWICTKETLQVVSVKVASIEEGLHWPLHVFGMVSVRDVVDRKRNIIFHRERDNCQTITKKDPYLTLTGPSRAVVVCIDPSYIEVVLKVKGATESEDKELSRAAVAYRHTCLLSGLYPSALSTIKMTFAEVYGSVEATVHVKVTGGSWPDGFNGLFAAATAKNERAKVKLLSVGEDGLPVDAADVGMIRLSRRVVSVELRGMLKLFVSACRAAGDEEERCEVSFVPQKDGVSPGVELKIGSCRMEATVAWSLFCAVY